MTRVLILGGTGEAAQLARALAAHPDMEVVNSLAGRTESVPDLPGMIRVGGFGGASGLADYLRAHAIDRVIDATHPFAARISAHAAQACAAVPVPRLMLVRPSWQKQPGDTWIEVETMAEAAHRIGKLARRAFLTVGVGDIGAFAGIADVWFLVRLIAAQPLPLADYRVITGKGPFDALAEQRLMTAHGVEAVITKASGGTATHGKLAAARFLGLPVLMVKRPIPPHGEQVDSVAAAIGWLYQRP